jgi:RNA polymerase sigma factor (TIGR02999 family)
MPIVYAELHRLAHLYMRAERPGHPLQTTALVNEAYLRLISAQHVDWRDRAHFFAISAKLMRRILVDFARSQGFQKRGAGASHFSLHEGFDAPAEPDLSLVNLDDALQTLEEIDARKAKVVEMRYFGGLSVEETAEALGVSQDTVLRDWRLAKAWLHRELRR